jgi:uncharacterized membrane protein YgdD (TMEM256/DUF423 family)
MTQRITLLLAAIAGFTAVAFGAFAAHLLDDRVGEYGLEVFETGARYHAYHALALLGLAGLIDKLGRPARIASVCFALGIVIFSGSLYLLALTDLRWLGAITPIGGTLWLIGWACLAFSAIAELFFSRKQ